MDSLIEYDLAGYYRVTVLKTVGLWVPYDAVATVTCHGATYAAFSTHFEGTGVPVERVCRLEPLPTRVRDS